MLPAGSSRASAELKTLSSRTGCQGSAARLAPTNSSSAPAAMM